MNRSSLNSNLVLVASVIEVLNQGEALLSELDDESYTRKLPTAFNASIGGHYRHCLDHFRSLFDALPRGHLNYDQRERGTLIENDRFAALVATRALRNAWQLVSAECLKGPLEVTCRTNHLASSSQTSPSTIAREVMYVVAHAVHHFALIGVMAGLIGLKMPAEFGVAPSTMKYQADSAKREVGAA